MIHGTDKGKWVYWYRAVDIFGETIDFMHSEHRDELAVGAFYKPSLLADFLTKLSWLKVVDFAYR